MHRQAVNAFGVRAGGVSRWLASDFPPRSSLPSAVGERGHPCELPCPTFRHVAQRVLEVVFCTSL